MNKLTPLAVAGLSTLLTTTGCCMNYNPTFTFGPGDTLIAIPENAGGPVGYIYRGPVWQAVYGHMNLGTGDLFQSLWRDLEEAKANGNEELAEHYLAEIRGFGRVSGEGWGVTPMYTLLVEIDDDLIALAHKHGIGRIIEGEFGTEGIDLTDELIERLRPPVDAEAAEPTNEYPVGAASRRPSSDSPNHQHLPQLLRHLADNAAADLLRLNPHHRQDPPTRVRQHQLIRIEHIVDRQHLARGHQIEPARVVKDFRPRHAG